MSTEPASAHEVVLENDLVYSVELPTLQQMASYQVSLAIWYGYVSTPRHFLWRTDLMDMDGWLPYLGVKTTHQRDMNNLIEELRTPRRIEEMLKKSTTKIRQELIDWVKHLSEDLFPDVMQKYSIIQVDSRWCVWTANGEIDYRKSAEKMLNSGQLNDVQKFVVWSKYCMEDQVKTISLESLPECVGKVSYVNDPILFYWICYLRNELNKVPIAYSGPLHVNMVSECYGGRRMAMEYFWQCSLNHLYHLLLVFTCEDPRSWCIFERLFDSENCNLQSLPHFVEYMVIGSLIYSRSSSYPCRLWRHFKHLISDESFAKFVIKVLEHALGVEEKMKLLMDVWDTADDHHKDSAVRQWYSILMFFIRPWTDPPCPTAFEFLSNYIMHLSSRVDKLNGDYITPLLLCMPDIDFLEKMLNLCGVAPHSLPHFKKCALQSQEFLQFVDDSFEHVNFHHLNTKLKWLCSEKGPNAVPAYKKKILRNESLSREMCHWLLDFEKWNKLCDFIDETYAEETLQALEMKQAFVKSLTCNCFEELYFLDGFDTIKKIVESVYSHKQLRDYKSDFLAKFGATMKDHSYWKYEEISYETFESVIDWCCGTDRVKISQFRKKVPYGSLVSIVLDRLLMNNVFELRRPVLAEILLNRLQKHLMWYLDDENNVNQYKLRRITKNYPSDMKIFKMLLMKNESCLMVILRWFFNGSETQAVEFRPTANFESS